MPDSVLMPAPLKTTARRLLRIVSFSRSVGELSVLKPVILNCAGFAGGRFV
jgi:hypothetical protein